MQNNFSKTEKKPSGAEPAGAVKALLLLAETVLLLALGLLCTALLIVHGPSERAKARLFARFPLAVFSSGPSFSSDAAGENPTGASSDAAFSSDGVLLTPVYGRGYAGVLLTVEDPARVIVGCVPSSLGGRGFSVEELCRRFGAVAGVNAGGFLDEGGTGNGATPDSLLVYEGKSYFGGFGWGHTFVGLDEDHRLVIGQPGAAEIAEKRIRYGVCFGPALLENGEITQEASLPSDVNPRSAIGQRPDGAILLLVIDGRHALSMGATIRDMAEILQRCGAETACNLDGGTSSVLWYDGSYRNTLPLLYMPRPVPDAFLVLAKEG